MAQQVEQQDDSTFTIFHIPSIGVTFGKKSQNTSDEGSTDSDDEDPPPSPLSDDATKPKNETIEWTPKCARCRSHNTTSSVRGHKRYCEYRDCTCPRCRLIDERRRVMSAQLALRRAAMAQDEEKGVQAAYSVIKLENRQTGTIPKSLSKTSAVHSPEAASECEEDDNKPNKKRKRDEEGRGDEEHV